MCLLDFYKSTPMSLPRLIKRLNEPIAVIAGIITLIGSVYAGYEFYSNWRNKCDLSGSWKFTFYIESSSLKSTIGKSAEYQIYISQTSESVNGNGEKRKVNGVAIPTAQHDRLTFKGAVEDRKLNVTYTLFGTRRTTDGTFSVNVKDDKRMEGTFDGTAATTKGRVVAIKNG